MNKVHGRENDSVEVVSDVQKSDVALREEAMLKFWQENNIFKKSVETPAGAAPVGDFVFYDGPPFATGLPHYGHILAGTIKDAIPRFWTMNGYRVNRKWGWDCHGLPLENLIEKELGLGTKRDIEEYGVKNFNEKARGAVMRYADDWREIIPRMGRFVDMADDYKTMDSTYTESVWWVFKSLFDKGLVYEGFKSMHLCPRCGTTLSNFEVNQGYKDIKDIAVTVKLPLLDDAGNVTDTSLLVWTTTPWTLPGNMAAAVHSEIEYVKVTVKGPATGYESGTVTSGEVAVQVNAKAGESFIVAKGRLAQLIGIPYEIVEQMKGVDLVGKKYLPPFDYIKNAYGSKVNSRHLEFSNTVFENVWQIYHADYVEVGEEGTGAVHIAPAYGDDDLKLAEANNLPIIHHVDNTGHFVKAVADLAGRLVKPKDDEQAGVDHKDTDIEILRALQATGKIFKKENITHSYPHCWRCDTPLLNYATTSWFVKVPEMKDDLIAANNSVKWVPEHVGTNRFGKWLEGARDWAISRQRYWGAPLPIWRNPETKEVKVIGSLKDLQQFVRKSGNTYLVMRHGESEYNTKHLLNSDPSVHNPLTEEGTKQIQAAASDLRDIDLIVASPIQRTKESALIAAEALGLEVEFDDRLLELHMGELEGKTVEDKAAAYGSMHEKFTVEKLGVETLNHLRARVGAFITDLEAKHQGKRILIITHGDTAWMLEAVTKGATTDEAVELGNSYIKNGEVRELPYVPFPHNDYFELDYHRPYIDEIDLFEGDTKLERIPDVFDCWFESGSMPYAQHHFMGENKEGFEKNCFPANFIAEGLDQTRGWFYSLIVLGTALFGKSPFENVVVNGTVLAEDGRKMSKSLQNYPDPMEVAHAAGADAMRFYLLSSPAAKGEDFNFTEKEVLELQRKNIGRLHNVLAMYEMFADGTKVSAGSQNVLDCWILARLQELVNDSTAGYKSYELDKATRPISDFIDDLSVWYLRRSRDRLKMNSSEKPHALDFVANTNPDVRNAFPTLAEDNFVMSQQEVDEKTQTLATLRYTLRILALVMAPVMPFYAEHLWRQVKEEGDAESVHLGKWPEGGSVDEDLIVSMQIVRNFVTMALEARTKANVKVRQPLAILLLPSRLMVKQTDLLSLIQDEVNVKRVEYSSEIQGVQLDVNLTPELIAEGNVRELMRAVQGRRKTEGLSPQDAVLLTISASDIGRAAIEANRDMLVKTVGASELIFADIDGEVVATDTEQFIFSLKKVS